MARLLSAIIPYRGVVLKLEFDSGAECTVEDILGLVGDNNALLEWPRVYGSINIQLVKTWASVSSTMYLQVPFILSSGLSSSSLNLRWWQLLPVFWLPNLKQRDLNSTTPV